MQEAGEELEPKKSSRKISAAEGEILAESDLSTKGDDIIKMLDSEDRSER